jgi:hypothetical protein
MSVLNYTSRTRLPFHRKLLFSFLTILLFYVVSYGIFRARGTVRPFYNQGSYDMDVDSASVELVFCPLIELERTWHNKFSPAPTGW